MIPVGIVGIVGIVGCAQPAVLVATAEWVGDGVEIHASSPVAAVTIETADPDGADPHSGQSGNRSGLPIASRDLLTPSRVVFVSVSRAALVARTGDAATVLRVEVAGEVAGEKQSVNLTLLVPPPALWTADVQPAPGAGWVAAKGTVEVPVWADTATIFVRLTAGATAVDVSTNLGIIHLPAPGSRALVAVPVSGDRTLQIGDDAVELVAVHRDPALAGSELRLEDLVFPAELNGMRDLGRPVDAIVLPSPVWERVLKTTGAGTRVRADEEPWSYVSVPIVNDGAQPVDLLVTTFVTTPAGDAVPAFRPRLRSADGGGDRTAALLRVPAGGRSQAALPVFVDGVDVAPGVYALHVEVTPLGAASPAAASTLSLVVQRGDPISSVGFLIATLVSLAGLTWTARTLPRWLRRASATDLMVNALFGTTLFVVSTATDVLSMSIGTVLGPFATLLTGMVYDAGRTVLLATLLQLQPRPGTLTLSILCCWLGRGVLTGAISAPDLLHTGVAIALGEGFAWLAGLTRGRPLTVLRLSVALGVSNALLTLSGLWLHMILYRLTFAGWYIALQVGIPGFLYVILACWLAVPFAQSLQRVDA